MAPVKGLSKGAKAGNEPMGRDNAKINKQDKTLTDMADNIRTGYNFIKTTQRNANCQ
jgi:hypothetical protein